LPHQTKQPVGDQVSLVNVRRQAGTHPAGNVFDQRRVGDDESLLGDLILILVPAPPKLTKLDGT
jgi:hypothetical protein